MRAFRFNRFSLCFLLSFLSFYTNAAIDEQLQSQAESGNSTAQIKLAIAFRQEHKTDQAHYWLIKAALQGDTNAITQLGELFESDKNGSYSALSLAENWYLIGSDIQLTESESGYARVLEAQFNNKRAKQVSSITVLDDQIDEDIQQARNQSSGQSTHQQNRVNSEIFIISLLLASVIVYVSLKRLFRRKTHIKKNTLNEQITAQNKKINMLQRHLSLAHSQLKKNQDSVKKDNQEQSIAIACAVLGYHPAHLPSEKEIKLRYKKLSRVYHPDTNGSDDDMKRLNTAIKIISSYLKQRRQ